MMAGFARLFVRLLRFLFSLNDGQKQAATATICVIPRFHVSTSPWLLVELKATFAQEWQRLSEERDFPLGEDTVSF